MRGPPSRDRGVTPTLTYVFAIGIVTILVAALLVGTTTFVDDERSSVVRQELQIVGDRLAADVAAVDVASRRGATVSQRTSVPDRVADTPYNLAVVDCTAGPACLELDSADPDIEVTVTVPLSNQSAVRVDRRSTQSVRIVADPSGRTAADADADVSVNPNIGVAEGVNPGSGASGVTFNPTTAPVIQGFRFSPTPPATGETVTFESDVVEVVDGNYTYAWDLDGDGTTEESGNGSTASVVTTSYGQPGRYPVTLTVTGPGGQSDSITQLVRVSGLILNTTTTPAAIDTNGDDDNAGVGFLVDNNFDSREVRITDVTVRPESSDVQSIDNDAGPEVAVRGVEGYEIDDDPARDEPAGTDYSLNDNGTIFELTEPQTVGSDEFAGVQIGEFFTASGDEYPTLGQTFDVSVRYDAGGDTNYVSRFEITPGTDSLPDIPQPPVVGSITVEDCASFFDPDHTVEISVSDADGNLDEVTVVATDTDGGSGSVTADISDQFDDDGETATISLPAQYERIEVTAVDDDGKTDTRTREDICS
jgi:hypothetical protein